MSGLDMNLYDAFLAAEPDSVQTRIREDMKEAITAYEMDRHFACHKLVDGMVQLLASSGSKPRSAEAPPAAAAAVPKEEDKSTEEGAEQPSQPAAAATTTTEAPVDPTPSPPPPPPPPPPPTCLLELLEQSLLRKVSMKKAEECMKLVDDASLDNHTWHKVSVDKHTGHGTYYRVEPGCDSYSFRVVGNVKQGIIPILSVLVELDMYKEWFPMCYHSEPLGSLSRFHRFSRFSVRLPWPVANREVACTGYGIDDLESMRVVISAQSLKDNDTVGGDKPVPDVLEGCVRADLKYGGFVLDLVEENLTRVTFMMNVDPKLYLPNWLINWVCGKMFWVLLYQIQKVAESCCDPKSPYVERRKLQPEVYDYFDKRIKTISHLLKANTPTSEKPADKAPEEEPAAEPVAAAASA